MKACTINLFNLLSFCISDMDRIAALQYCLEFFEIDRPVDMCTHVYDNTS